MPDVISSSFQNAQLSFVAYASLDTGMNGKTL